VWFAIGKLRCDRFVQVGEVFVVRVHYVVPFTSTQLYQCVGFK
jgi:hypothetical protein